MYGYAQEVYGNDNTFNRVIGKWLERAQYVNTPALPEAAE